MPLDLVAVVLTESIKLLMKDGWKCLKAISGDSELIQLNIGEHRVVEGQEQELEKTVQAASPQLLSAFSRATILELEGLNRQLDDLLIQKSKLLGNVYTGSTAIDRAMTEAAVARSEREIEETQRKIWRLLERSGRITVQPVAT